MISDSKSIIKTIFKTIEKGKFNNAFEFLDFDKDGFISAKDLSICF